MKTSRIQLVVLIAGLILSVTPLFGNNYYDSDHKLCLGVIELDHHGYENFMWAALSDVKMEYLHVIKENPNIVAFLFDYDEESGEVAVLSSEVLQVRSDDLKQRLLASSSGISTHQESYIYWIAYYSYFMTRSLVIALTKAGIFMTRHVCNVSLYTLKISAETVRHDALWVGSRMKNYINSKVEARNARVAQQLAQENVGQKQDLSNDLIDEISQDDLDDFVSDNTLAPIGSASSSSSNTAELD